MSECNKERGEYTLAVLGGQPEEEPEHEASDYVDDDCQHAEDDGIPADALVYVGLCLNLIHLDIYNYRLNYGYRLYYPIIFILQPQKTYY